MENGEDALEILRNASVDLVLLDVMMPGISGFDVLKSIRENKKLQSLPVIIITGLADKENRLKGLQLGADDFIAKPFDVDELLVKISSQIKLAFLRNQVSRTD
jgi:Response regulators consisting of a CheY-like receiver domain and a winged-helix DNA-binding domain